MLVITRFAPSPTGDLHIGGIRTALFNWLFAQSHGGKFLLRVEDTDHDRFAENSLNSIIEGLSWMNLHWNEEIVYQSKNVDYHRNIAYELLEKKLAYKCYLTQKELSDMRENNDYSELRKYRDNIVDLNTSYVIRFKMPLEGKIVMKDLVQGDIEVECKQLEDFVILRQDANPTYNLSCAADDHKMNITHIIRGDDHITNAFKQISIFNAMGWSLPNYAHIPLIHNESGQKLSKRNQDAGISYYRDLGILPEAMLNYLLRLGWSHGDDEIISIEKAIEWFNLDNIGKSASQLNMDKLLHINGVYLRQKDNFELLNLLDNYGLSLGDEGRNMFKKAMGALKIRSNTLNELKDTAHDFFANRLPRYGMDVPNISPEARDFLKSWDINFDESELRSKLEKCDIKLKDIAPFIRFALSGKKVSPGIFDMIQFLGEELTKYRIDCALRL
ncbi:glutamate--tRNA ligase [Candidatus Cytomitobacter indipagum]|uniref:Glutamate--tRNA ligase n=1 Tax=Candidatus Cytomitobacter indipagum TaxID=2601575 RepID=A0A5C0UCZ0_9PROT|nr:glutamate--tRNA ligase [Candidatus Cytomitobacter indipagum]QEK37838.1 glutamate--tRNA ligase [Candidatus Cytomitobacter indipagum]